MNRLKLPLLSLACALPLAACAATPEALTSPTPLLPTATAAM